MQLDVAVRLFIDFSLRRGFSALEDRSFGIAPNPSYTYDAQVLNPLTTLLTKILEAPSQVRRRRDELGRRAIPTGIYSKCLVLLECLDFYQIFFRLFSSVRMVISLCCVSGLKWQLFNLLTYVHGSFASM